MKDNPNPGDHVKVHTKEEVIKGVFLPRSDILDKRSGEKILSLKLENGYNIGVSYSKIKGVEVTRRHKDKEVKKVKRTPRNDLPKVLIISCGGTISSRVDYVTGGVYADYTSEDFIEMMPELQEIAEIDAEPLLDKMSEDLLPADWKKMARTIYNRYSSYDGFVITQGTDTLHYSSAALSFFLQGLGKPVVFTAAQRSIDRGSSDAFMNLTCALKFASSSNAGGIFVCMHGSIDDSFCHIHKGTKVRKMHSLRRDAFRSINDTPVAKVDYDKVIQTKENNSPIEFIKSYEDGYDDIVPDAVPDDVRIEDGFSDDVALIHFHPNQDPDIIDYHLSRGAKGIVFAGTALGHISMNGPKSFKKKIDMLRRKKIPVVMTTQSLYGRVDPLVYSTLRYLSIEGNVIFAEDMLPEVAYVKLSWILSQKFSYEEVKDRMLHNFAGEINQNIRPDQFLN